MKKIVKLLFVPLMALPLAACSSSNATSETEISSQTSLSDESEDSMPTSQEEVDLTYPIVDTGVVDFYSNDSVIDEPNIGEDFYGQDANYQSDTPSYTDNGNSTVTDNVTGLMWQQDMGVKMTYANAVVAAKESTLAGYDDWRLPTIKELYSLIQFTGDGGGEVAGTNKFIDTDYFVQPIGDTSIGEREIDAQTWSSTIYVGETMKGDKTVFGVNFIDGRIKGYPYYKRTVENTAYFRFVRGDEEYGKNNFVDNKDGTITDLATGLMWQQIHLCSLRRLWICPRRDERHTYGCSRCWSAAQRSKIRQP